MKVPFLTDIDPQVAVKGSRDPLGIQQIWARLGRHVVGNLTTVSNSVRDFTTLLVGYYFTDTLADKLETGSELNTFLKWEQLSAYSRAVANRDYVFRGTERVRKRLSESARVIVSAERSQQILADQKIYGLWGLYTVPANASGLVEGHPPHLTPIALDFVRSNCLPILERKGSTIERRIRDILCQPKYSLDTSGKDADIIAAIGQLLKTRLSSVEKMFYRDHLLYGGPLDSTRGLQRQLAELLGNTIEQDDFYWSVAMVNNMAKTARAKAEKGQQLARRLDRIRASATVFGPVSMLFDHLLGLHGKDITFIRNRLKDSWGKGLRTVDLDGFRELGDDLGSGDAQYSERWIKIATAAAEGDYGQLVNLLLEQNKIVMKARNGAPWLEMRSNSLYVRFQDEQGELPMKDTIPNIWRFSYFLDSLRNIAISVKGD